MEMFLNSAGKQMRGAMCLVSLGMTTLSECYTPNFFYIYISLTYCNARLTHSLATRGRTNLLRGMTKVEYLSKGRFQMPR